MRKFGFGSISQITRISSLLVAVAMLTTVGAAYAKTSKPLNGPRGPALWVVNKNANSVAEFKPNKLQISDETNPSRVLVSADLDEPWGLIFDSRNNLWVSNIGNGTLTEFTLKQLKGLKKNDAPEAAVVISGLDRPEGLAFDGAGNLWVANEGNGQLLEFTASQLRTTGSPVPNALTDPSELRQPVGIAFDHSENLWVSDDHFQQVLMFTKTQLAAGGSQSATVLLTDDGSGSIDECEPLIFDKSGDLWMGNNEDPVQHLGSVVKFTPGQLAHSGSPTPAVMLTSTEVNHTPPPILDIPTGLAFDGGGNLWVANQDSDHAGSVAKFDKKLIGSSGSPAPTVFIDSNATATNLTDPFFLAFGPEVR